MQNRKWTGWDSWCRKHEKWLNPAMIGLLVAELAILAELAAKAI